MSDVPHPAPSVKDGGRDQTPTCAPSTFERALALLNAGRSVFPIRLDGTKKPALAGSNPFLEDLPTEADLQRWFQQPRKPYGIAIACGRVSGWLQVLDFDKRSEDIFFRWSEMVRTIFPDLLEQVAIIKTPNGYHVHILCPDLGQVENQKLAMCPDDGSGKTTLIETRGHHGYVLVPGCPPECHPDGGVYVWHAGADQCDLEPIGRLEVEALFELARSFDERPLKAVGRPRKAGEELPGEHFDRAGPSWADLLEPAGWKCGRMDGPAGYWTRPGKEGGGYSGTTGICRGQDGNDLFHVFSTNADPFEAGESYGKFRTYTLLVHDGDIRSSVKALDAMGYGSRAAKRRSAGPAEYSRPNENPANPSGNDNLKDSPLPQNPGVIHPNEGTPSLARRLLDYALEGKTTLFLDQQAEAYVRFAEGGRQQVAKVDSEQARRWLARLCLGLENKLPGEGALNQVCFHLGCEAERRGNVEAVYVRVARHDGKLYLDLRDDAGQVVEITAKGWRTIKNPPVNFIRPKGMLPLPVPLPEGRLEDMSEMVNVPDRDAWMLTQAWMLAALRPVGPYPLLILSGQQGAAKSTFARMVCDLIDPHIVPLLPTPPESRELAVIASQRHTLVFDNLSGLTRDMSDALCRLATGGGFMARELYTDSGVAMFTFQRPVVLTSIDDIATRGDLLSRGMMLELQPIASASRRSEDDLWSEWAASRARFLGGLLNAASSMLAALPDVELPAMPRMADFARIGVAAGKACGWNAIEFIAAYDCNERLASSIVLDASVLAGPLQTLLNRNDGWWQGTASELLDKLKDLAGELVARSKQWPSAANGLSNMLNRLAPSLAAAGIRLVRTDSKTRNKQRLIQISRVDN